MKIPYIALPNILANKKFVPEVVQYDLTAENLSKLLLAQLAYFICCSTLVG